MFTQNKKGFKALLIVELTACNRFKLIGETCLKKTML